MLDDLVRAVRRPDVVGAQPVPEVFGQGLTQRGEFAVGVAVDCAECAFDAAQNVGNDIAGNRVRVLVDVELNSHVRLRCTVRLSAAQVVANRQIVKAGHLASLKAER
ncbi:unannotated protein [freshwater metagenome]|uniref:Unannotated protein n=1 Tax=freshwater metagenome TaxID=449393 RepID=A0A6J6D132_9ZZZZ